jgi:TPR repeat protein
MKWYCEAADRGETNAQCNVGTMYLTGQGVPQWSRLDVGII